MEEPIRFYTSTECDEQCGHCGYILKKNEDLPMEGMPISGTYYICPNCQCDWFDNMKEINVKKTEMVDMTKEHYENLLKKVKE